MIKSAILLNFILILSKQGLSFFLFLLVGRMLGSQMVGELTFFSIIIGITSIFCQGGASQLIIKHNCSKESVLFSIKFSFISIFIIFIFLFFFKKQGLIYVDVNLLFFGVLFRVAQAVVDSILLANEKFSIQATSEILSNCIAFLITLEFFVNEFIFIFFALQSFISICLSACFFSKIKIKPTKSLDNDFLRCSLDYIITQCASLYTVNIDNILVKFFMGSSNLGYYSRSYQLLVVPAVVLGQVIQKISFPKLVKNINNSTAIESYFRCVNLIVFVFSLSFTFCCVLFSKEIIFYLYGDDWNKAAEILKIFSLSVFSRCIYKVYEPYILAKGYVNYLKKINLSYALLVSICVSVAMMYKSLLVLSWLIAVSIIIYSLVISVFSLYLARVDYYQVLVMNIAVIILYAILFCMSQYSFHIKTLIFSILIFLLLLFSIYFVIKLRVLHV